MLGDYSHCVFVFVEIYLFYFFAERAWARAARYLSVCLQSSHLNFTFTGGGRRGDVH